MPLADKCQLIDHQAISTGLNQARVTSPCHLLSRRQFVMSGLIAAGSVLGGDLTWGEDTEPVSTEELIKGPVKLVENRSLDTYRVRIAINVKGNVNLPENPLVSQARNQQLPITSDAVFDYEERYRWPGGTKRSDPVLGVERYYHEAASESVLNKTPMQMELRPQVRNVIVRRDTLPETIYSPTDHFNHDELGLLRTPVSGVSVGDLLPTKTIKAGETYSISNDAICSVLNLSSVDSTDIESTLVEVTEKTAKFELKGKLDGSVDGVPTLIRMVGKMTFDRQQRACTWLAMAVHETREIGKAEPGFDVSATVKMIRQPLEKVTRLPAQPARLNLEKPVDPVRLMVEIKSNQLDVAAMVDRRWRMMSDVPGSAMMRMIDVERSIAQCNLKPLVKLPDGKQWTLEAFQQDVKKSLSGQLRQLIQARQRVSANGLRVLQVTAAGQVEGVDIRWIMQHISDDQGRRILATFVMDAPSYAQLAGSEFQFADTMRLIPPNSLPPETPASSAPEEDLVSILSNADEVAAEAPSIRVATSGRPDELELRSASDVVPNDQPIGSSLR